MPTLNQRGVVHIALILLLLAGLVAGVYLVQHPQIFKPKAAGGKVWLIDESNNNLPQKDEGVYEVPGQEIRIFIHQPTVWSPPGSSSRPQGRLPNLVTAAYAQQSGQCGNTWSGQPTQCADSSGKTAGGTQCSGPYLGAYTGCSGNTLYCYSCPGTTAGGTGSSGTTTNTGTTTDASTPTITGASWDDQEGSYLTISGSGFGNSQGTVYYSRGGSEQIPSQSVNSWSAGLVKIGSEITLPGVTKSVDNMISRGNYLKVCRTDGKCSGYWTLDKDRPTFKVDIPTAPKDAPQGQGAPAAPTQPEVAEATQEIRISSVVDYVKKDGVCEGSEDPAKHCMSLTADNPDQRYTFAALLTKGYVDWWLANTTEDQNVYVGFISNKGTNYTESIKVRIVRPQPTARPTGSPSPSPSPAGGSAKKPACPIFDDGGACVNESGKTVGNNLTCAGTDESNTYSCSNPAYPTCLTGVSCKSSAITGGGTGQAAAPAKTSCREVGICVKDTGDEEGFYDARGRLCSGIDGSETYSCPPDYPICLIAPARCGPFPPALSPTPSPSPSPAGGSAKKPACPIFDDGGACVNESGKTVGNNLTCAGTDESNTYSCSNPAYPTCLTGVSCKSSAITGGGTGQAAAGTISVQNNTNEQVTVNKVEVESGRFLGFLWTTFTSISGRIFTLDPKRSADFPVTSGICSSDDEQAKKEKEVKVNYTIDTDVDSTTGIPNPHEAQGKYQCGGSGTVTIP